MKRSIVLLATLTVCVLITCTSQSEKIRFKAVYLDMDGTTLDPDHEIRPATIEMLDRYRKCGGRVGIITGRTYEMVQRYLKDIKPNLPLVLFNGAAIISPSGERIIFKSILDKDVIAKSTNYADYGGVEGIVVEYVDGIFVDRMNDTIRHYLKMFGVSKYKVCSDLMICANEKGTVLPIKITFLMKKDSGFDLEKQLKPVMGDSFRVYVTSPYSVEVVKKGTDKAEALKRVLSEENLSMDDIVVFGDSDNDAQMVGTVPVSMAMGNCRESTCEGALFKIGKNDTDAIARTIERLVMHDSCRIN